MDASPVGRRASKATLSFATRINASGTLNISEKDRAHAQGGSFNITNAAVAYTTQVGVGSPETDYTLLIDTGSSNTWIGASKQYIQTSTGQDTGNGISASYGSGSFDEVEWTDTITLAPSLVITDQSIGVASSSTGFSGVDGILGVGPVNLTEGTVPNVGTVPTVSDNLLAQGDIFEEVFGIYYLSASASSAGTLTFGGYDSSVISGSVDYVSLRKTSPASNYWGIEEAVRYGNSSILPNYGIHRSRDLAMRLKPIW